MKSIKKWLATVIVAAGFAASVCAASDQELFLEANELYKQEKFEEACRRYQEIKNPSVAVWYNIGNCNFKLDKLGKALACWRRAELEWGLFNRSELLNNIDCAKKKLYERRNAALPEHKRRPREELGWYKQLRMSAGSLIRCTPLILLQLMVLALWMFLFISLRTFLRKKKHAMIVVLFGSLLLLASLLAIKYGLVSRQYGLVVTPAAAMYSGHSDSYKKIGELVEGQEGFIVREEGSFYKIRFGDRLGWVDSSSFEKI